MSHLEKILIPILSACILLFYHLFLIYRVIYYPQTTVIGLTRSSRRDWVRTIIQDKNSILGVQTLRNWIMGSSLLATTSVAVIVSLVAILTSISSSSSNVSNSTASTNKISPIVSDLTFTQQQQQSNLTNTISTNSDSTASQFSSPLSSALISNYQVIVIICFLMISFFWLTQAIRIYNHVSILLTISTPKSFNSENCLSDEKDQAGEDESVIIGIASYEDPSLHHTERQPLFPSQPTTITTVTTTNATSANVKTSTNDYLLNKKSPSPQKMESNDIPLQVLISNQEQQIQSNEYTPVSSTSKQKALEEMNHHHQNQNEVNSINHIGPNHKMKKNDRKLYIRNITRDVEFSAALLNRGALYNTFGVESLFF